MPFPSKEAGQPTPFLGKKLHREKVAPLKGKRMTVANMFGTEWTTSDYDLPCHRRWCFLRLT
jgi:hypothetical protein